MATTTAAPVPQQRRREGQVEDMRLAQARLELSRLLHAFEPGEERKARSTAFWRARQQRRRRKKASAARRDEEDNSSHACPITLAPLRDLVNPVIASDGHVYEREAIVQWLRTNPTSPLTRQRIDGLLALDTARRAVAALL